MSIQSPIKPGKRSPTSSQETSSTQNELIDRIAKEYKDNARVSLSYYGAYYLGLTSPAHQHKWYDMLDKYPNTGLISPRDHGKTTIAPRVLAEHNTLFNKDYNVLLLNKTYKQAQKSLKVIDKDLTKNPFIQSHFADELSDYEQFGNQLIFNQSRVRRDATIEANGLLGDITGGHFDLIIADDLVDDANTRTPQSRQDTIDWFEGTILPLLEEDGRIVVIGTRKHFNDLYQNLIDNPMWFIIEEKAILQMPESYDYITDEEGMIVGVENIIGDYEVLWPQKWPIEKLLLKLKQMGLIMFNREYQNDPSGMEGQLLKLDWLQYWATPEQAEQYKLPKDVRIITKEEILVMPKFQGYDLAISKKESADFTVCTTAGVFPNGDKVILDWFRDQIDFPAQVKSVPRLYNIWNPQLIAIESNAYQKALPESVLEESALPIKEVYADTDKTRKIVSQFVDFENKKVWIPYQHPQLDNFTTEYLHFNKGEHDDILDSTCYTLFIAKPTRPVVSTAYVDI
jgi:predicted phage terminase large subunit-like protein